MVARRTGTRRTPVSARMLASSTAATPNRRAPADRPYAPPESPPRGGVRGGGQVVHPCGQHLNAHGHAIWSADQMHTPSKELLPFRRALPAAFAPGRLPTAPGAPATASWQGEAIDNEHVACGDAPLTFAGIQDVQSAG